LVFFFHWGLYFVGKTYGLPVYPKTEYETTLVYALAGFVVVSWLLGERKRFFLVIAYFVTFQILIFALVSGDYALIPRTLTPLLFTYLPLFLFKSPAEFHKELVERRQREILKELERSKSLLEDYQKRLNRLREEYSALSEEKAELEKLLRESKAENLERLVKQKEDKLREYERRIEELEKTLGKIKENNRQLWELLEESTLEGGDEKKLRRQLAQTRKELKKSKKELLECREKLKNLREELRRSGELLEELEKESDLCREERQKLLRKLEVKENELRKLAALLDRELVEFLNLLFERIRFSPRALVDFAELDPQSQKHLLKFLRKLERAPEGAFLEPLELAKGKVYKARFSGGRVYLTREGEYFVVEGILKGEDSKAKDRFIRERFT